MTVVSDSDTKLASAITVDGTNEPKFSPVRDALLENFAGGDEIGAAVSICIDGKTVVDLWGGHQDAARTRGSEYWNMKNAVSASTMLALRIRFRHIMARTPCRGGGPATAFPAGAGYR